MSATMGTQHMELPARTIYSRTMMPAPTKRQRPPKPQRQNKRRNVTQPCLTPITPRACPAAGNEAEARNVAVCGADEARGRECQTRCVAGKCTV